MSAKPLTTVLSTKGQLILPKAVRDGRGWGKGARLVVTDTPEGVLLAAEEPASPFPPTRIEDVFGMLRSDRAPASLVDMREGAIQGAVERYERSRGGT